LERHRNNYRYLYNKAIGILKGDQICYDHSAILKKFQEKEEDATLSVKELKELENLKHGEVKKASHGIGYSKFDLKSMIAPEIMSCMSSWLNNTGSSIRSQASFEAHKNWKTNIDLVKSGAKRFFDLRFKKKKEPTWTFNIEHANVKTRDYKNKTEFSLYEESGYIKTTEQFEIKNDCKIHFDGLYYYVIVPYSKPLKESKADNFFVALDPGVRKFQVAYSPDHQVNMIGVSASKKIYQLLLMIDNAISSKNKILETKLRIRIQNLQKELHDKTSRFLCENYRVIYIPKLTSGNDIINKKLRKIRTKTVRSMVLLAHCAFVEKLKTKALEYTNVKVQIVTEEYTSQTCPKCHTRTKTANEIFKCKSCQFKIDRDILGSRNILLKTWNLM